MIINSLKLHNFGVYAFDNEFDFTSTKPITLIGGFNGRGKTTFLEAVLLALYGSESFAYKESKYSSYGRYLYNHVNRNDGTLESFVELDFTLDGDHYIVHRNWNGNLQRVHENISITKNGKKDDFLSHNWQMFIENVLPSEISKFFFFDGEKIASLAEDDTSVEMKEAIKSMLGISTLDVLRKDLNRIVSKTSNDFVSKKEKKEIERLRRNKDESQKALLSLDEKKETIKVNLENLNKEIEQLHAEYITAGGEAASNHQNLLLKKAELTSTYNQINHSLIDVASTSLPLLMVSDLLHDIDHYSELELEKKNQELALKQIKKAYNRYKDSHHINQDTEQFIEYFKEQVLGNKIEKLYDLSDDQLHRLAHLINNDLNNQANQAKSCLISKKNIKSKIENVETDLSVEVDENKINNILKNIKKLEAEKISLEAEQEALESQRSGLNGQARHDESVFNKYVENVLRKLEKNDENMRMVQYIQYAQNILNHYEIKLQERKINELAETMTDCYKKLASKKNMIEYIKMDSKTLDFLYFNENDEIVPKNSLSAGEKQLMIISLLWSLAICSKKKLPVIIDTPLSRLDRKHREAIVTKYFPHASDQTIILSTDSEIDRYYYDMMKEYVGDTYLLKYNEQTKNTVVVKGYFSED